MTMHVRVSGTHQTVAPHARVAGTWRACTEGWVRVAGVWQQFFAATLLALTSRTISALTFGTTCLVGSYFYSTGGLQERRNASYTSISGEWAKVAVTGNDYEIYAENLSSSGVSSSTGTFNTWLSLDVERSWTISRTTTGEAFRTIRFTIRKKADHSDSVIASHDLQAAFG